MKKHNMMRAASALAVVTLLSTSLISGTLAKYTSSGSGSDSARVAKWSFSVNSKDLNEQSFDFNLFDTIKNTGGENLQNGIVNTVSGDSIDSKIIAPGTTGSADLLLKNDSEVPADYKID